MKKLLSAVCIALCVTIVAMFAVNAAGTTTFYQNVITKEESKYVVNASITNGYENAGNVPGSYYNLAYSNDWTKFVTSDDQSWGGYVTTSFSYDDDGSCIISTPRGDEEKSFKQIQTRQKLNSKTVNLITDIKNTTNAKMAIDISGEFSTLSNTDVNEGSIQYCLGGVTASATMLTKKDSLKLVSGQTVTILFDVEQFENTPSFFWIQFNNATIEGGTEWVNPSFKISLPYLYCPAQNQPVTTEAPLMTTPDSLNFTTPQTFGICSLDWVNANTAYSQGSKYINNYFFLTNKTDSFQKQIHSAIYIENMSDIVRTANKQDGRIAIDIYPTFATGAQAKCYVKFNWSHTAANGDYDYLCSSGEKMTLYFNTSDLADGESTNEYTILFQNYTYGSGISPDCQFCVTAPYIVDSQNNPIQTELLYGDCDDNGTVDIADVLLQQKYLSKTESVKPALLKSDYNHDGNIDIKDVIEIKRLITLYTD